MICEGTKEMVCTAMHARIPNKMILRDRWLNLCIDVNSFIKECFTKNIKEQVNTLQVGSSQTNVARISGDIGMIQPK